MKWNGALGHMGRYMGVGVPASQTSTVGASWMSPGHTGDAVRVFNVPHTGLVSVTAAIRKDIYHTYGDGVRAKVLKNNDQLWPETGWESIAAGDVVGKTMAVKVEVKTGDKIFFILNRNGNATDDETFWNPQIAYDRIDDTPRRTEFTITDSGSSRLKYSGLGWQRLGLNPWNSDVDQGYLPGWFQGTVSVSSAPGATMIAVFNGTGNQVLGDIGGDGGIAAITLDGKSVATIDKFAPSHVPSSIWSLPSKRIGHWAPVPPIPVWGIQGLAIG